MTIFQQLRCRGSRRSERVKGQEGEVKEVAAA